MTLDELSGAIQAARDGGEQWHIEPTNDGDGDGSGAIVVDEDGEVVATIRREQWVPLPMFHRAMKALDATFNSEEYGHG